MGILKDLLGRVFRHRDESSQQRVSEWELLVYTRQFSYEWQIQGLQDTENERVRKSANKKELQTRTLQHKAKVLYEWQRKDLKEESEGAWTRAEREGWRPDQGV